MKVKKVWGIESTIKGGDKWLKRWTGPIWKNIMPLCFNTRREARMWVMWEDCDKTTVKHRVIRCNLVFEKGD